MRSPTGIPLFFLNLTLLLLFSYIIADFCRIVNKVCVIFFDNSAKEQAGFRRSPVILTKSRFFRCIQQHFIVQIC